MLIPCTVIDKNDLPLRKKASDFAFAVYDSVSMINAAHWNIVAGEKNEFLNLDYLAALENNSPGNMRFHYALIYNEKTPVAIAYFQVIDFSSDSFGSSVEKNPSEEFCVTGYFKRHLKKHLKKTASKINMRLLICGNAFISGEHGFACVDGINKTEAFYALADVIYRISRAEKLRGKIAAVMVKDFYNNSLKESVELKEFKYRDFLVEPNMVVNIQWKTFEEYLTSMNKKYRGRAKSILKKGNDLERKNLSAAEIETREVQILELYRNVHLKANFRMASLTAGYFAGMKTALGDKFQFVAYYHGDKLVGFKTSFLLKNVMEAHFIGLDYGVNKGLELYQNILYDYVKEAIELNAEQLFLGRTASEIKSTIGAEAHELTCYIRHRNPLSNRILKPFVDYLKPTEWIPRNPFKDTVAN